MNPKFYYKHQRSVEQSAFKLWKRAYDEAIEAGWSNEDAQHYANEQRIRATLNLFFLAEDEEASATAKMQTVDDVVATG